MFHRTGYASGHGIIRFLVILMISAAVSDLGFAQQPVKRKKAAPATPPAATQPKEAQPLQQTFPLTEKVPKAVMTSAEFGGIVKDVFNGAYYDANSCAASDAGRKMVVHIPNAYHKEESLSRLHYTFSDGEKERSEGIHRRKAIRACVDGWVTKQWVGSIQNGRLKVNLPTSNIPVIKTRAIDEENRNIAGIIPAWKDRWDWNDASADNAIPDRRYWGVIEVFLKPVLSNGKLTYDAASADAKWKYVEPPSFVIPGSFYLESVEKPKITHYGDQQTEIIRQRVLNAFKNSNVRNRVTDALTAKVKTGSLAGRNLKSVTGQGDKIIVEFYPSE
ncbi:hypothetical protein JW906_07145 [bacterium]|nr:hypothetical protein [bacterium]